MCIRDRRYDCVHNRVPLAEHQAVGPHDDHVEQHYERTEIEIGIFLPEHLCDDVHASRSRPRAVYEAKPPAVQERAYGRREQNILRRCNIQNRKGAHKDVDKHLSLIHI